MSFFRKLANWYFRKNALPYWSIFLLDGVILFLSGFVSYWVFSSWIEATEDIVPLLCTLAVYVLLSIFGIRIFHTYAGVVRFSSFNDLMRVAYANLLSFFVGYGAHFLMYDAPQPPFLVLSGRHLLVMFVLATLAMWAVRILVKTIYDVSSSDSRAMRVLIYGALAGGVGLAKNIRSQSPQRFLLKGFISQDRRYRHNLLMGEKVFTLDDDLKGVIEKLDIDAVLVSPLRTNEFRDNQKVQDILLGAGVKIFMAQNAVEVKPGDENEAFENVQMREVSLEDLLPRNEIRVDMDSVGELLAGKRVLITGAAGSIGSEMVRQIAVYHPATLILIDQAETPEHDVRLLMRKQFPDIQAETVVTSICNKTRMDKIFHEYLPEFVFHAAAYKHVPMMEDNPSEAVYNNIYGTKVIADLSVKYGVKKFVMISTDKAVNPTNVMGCSKRICEMYVQALDRELKVRKLIDPKAKAETQFVTTRFGNVLGSNGSVIPLFREQIKNGGPVTVTDKNIVRYFMLIPEACKLVLEAGTKGNGGEIFVFDMGKPLRIAELAQRMINLSGAKNVKIEYTGLREGEKLYEEVLNDKEKTKPTFHEKIRIAEVQEYDYEKISKEIDELMEISKRYDNMETVKKMKEIVPEYKSNNSIYEELDK